jgi:hypothetical protein
MQFLIFSRDPDSGLLRLEQMPELDQLEDEGVTAVVLPDQLAA